MGILMERRKFLKEGAAAGLSAALGTRRAEVADSLEPSDKVRVLCWSERTEPARVYPQGMNGAIADALRKDAGFDVRTASINDPEQGLSKADLDATDVLIWFGHQKHKEVDDARVAEAVRQIRERGLGLIALHSSHFSKIFRSVLDCPGELGGWREDGEPEFLKCVAPFHPIAQGVGDFTIPHTEMYNEPFKVPPPEKTIFFSSWEAGEQFRSCNVWSVGKGRVVYFRPGHETYPIYFQELPLRVVNNAVNWCARRSRL